jgi:hypothetical protein
MANFWCNSLNILSDWAPNFDIIIRSGFKTPSKAQWLRCKPLQNVLLIPPLAGLRFFVGLCLALEPNLRF